MPIARPNCDGGCRALVQSKRRVTGCLCPTRANPCETARPRGAGAKGATQQTNNRPGAPPPLCAATPTPIRVCMWSVLRYRFAHKHRHRHRHRHQHRHLQKQVYMDSHRRIHRYIYAQIRKYMFTCAALVQNTPRSPLPAAITAPIAHSRSSKAPEANALCSRRCRGSPRCALARARKAERRTEACRPRLRTLPRPSFRHTLDRASELLHIPKTTLSPCAAPKRALRNGLPVHHFPDAGPHRWESRGATPRILRDVAAKTQ